MYLYTQSTIECPGQLEDVTNQGHSAFSRYQRRREQQDLERSIEQFECALNICPPDHPCRVATHSNMAIAKFILCQVKDTDISLDVPLTLYRNALSARPAGHLDRPSMLIRLTVVHLQQFKKRQHEVDAAQATGLLHEAINLSSAESHEKRVATSLLQLHAGGKTDPVQAGGQSSVGQNFTPDLTEEELWTFSIRSLDRFQLFRNLAASNERSQPWSYLSGILQFGTTGTLLD